jgi:hypothetical protein
MAGEPGPLLGIEHVEQIEHILRGQQSLLGAREYMNPGAATRDS